MVVSRGPLFVSAYRNVVPIRVGRSLFGYRITIIDQIYLSDHSLKSSDAENCPTEPSLVNFQRTFKSNVDPMSSG